MGNFFIIFMIIAGISANEICEKDLTQACDNTKIPNRIPDTEEELERACAPATEYFQCVINYGQLCNGYPESAGIASTYLSVVEEVCNENTLLHDAIVDNLQCFSEFENDEYPECYISSSSLLEEPFSLYIDILVEEGLLEISDNNYDNFNTRLCFRSMYRFACEATKIEKNCGATAMSAFNKIIVKLSPVIAEECDNTKDLLPAVIRIYKEEEKKNSRSDDTVERKK